VLLSHRIYSSGDRLGGGSTHEEPPLAIPLIIFRSQSKADHLPPPSSQPVIVIVS